MEFDDVDCSEIGASSQGNEESRVDFIRVLFRVGFEFVIIRIVTKSWHCETMKESRSRKWGVELCLIFCYKTVNVVAFLKRKFGFSHTLC